MKSNTDADRCQTKCVILTSLIIGMLVPDGLVWEMADLLGISHRTRNKKIFFPSGGQLKKSLKKTEELAFRFCKFWDHYRVPPTLEQELKKVPGLMSEETGLKVLKFIQRFYVCLRKFLWWKFIKCSWNPWVLMVCCLLTEWGNMVGTLVLMSEFMQVGEVPLVTLEVRIQNRIGLVTSIWKRTFHHILFFSCPSSSSSYPLIV